MSLDEMREAARNPKGHDIDRIRRSMHRFGFIDQAAMDERTGKLIGGHGRLESLIEARDRGDDPPDGVVVDDNGEWRWPVTRGWRSRDDEHAEAALVTLNRLTEAGGWDDIGGLADILEQTAAVDADLLDITGYSQPELDALLEMTRAPEHDADDDDDDDVLQRTDRASWPRISAQVPPDIAERWKAIPGRDDSDRVMAALLAWERQDMTVTGPDAEEAADE